MNNLPLWFRVVAQNTPTVVVLYFVLPVVLWGYIGAHWRQYAPLLQGKAAMYSAGFIIAAEALVRFLFPFYSNCFLISSNCFCTGMGVYGS